MVSKRNLAIFGASLGTLIGTIATLYPKRDAFLKVLKKQTESIAEKAADYISDRSHHGRQSKKRYFASGTLLGVLAGASAALLLSPKSGKSLRTQLLKSYSTISKKPERIITFVNNSNGQHSKKRSSSRRRKQTKPAASHSTTRE